MSLRKPKDPEKLVTRLLVLLTAWLLISPFLLGYLGGLLGGSVGAVMGVALAVLIGVWGYERYLGYSLKVLNPNK